MTTKIVLGQHPVWMMSRRQASTNGIAKINASRLAGFIRACEGALR